MRPSQRQAQRLWAFNGRNKDRGPRAQQYIAEEVADGRQARTPHPTQED